NDQSRTGVVTRSPLSHKPGTLHVQESPGFGHAPGSKPVMRSVTSNRTAQITIDPPTLNSVLMSGSEVQISIVPFELQLSPLVPFLTPDTITRFLDAAPSRLELRKNAYRAAPQKPARENQMISLGSGSKFVVSR